MGLKRFAAVLTLVVLPIGVVPICAQSLGDLAKKEENRRKKVKEPAKVYTNKDVGAPPQGSEPPPASSTPAARDADKEKDKEASSEATDKEPVKDQAYWAGRKKALQTALDRDQTYAEALQSRVNALSTDFVNRDDPAQRGVIGRDRQKAEAELGRLKQQIQTDKKALADLDEEARRAGVPPGWLR